MCKGLSVHDFQDNFFDALYFSNKALFGKGTRMENRLQDLTEKIYEEGIEKGRKKADELVAQAEEKGQNIVSDAKNTAEAIISSAKKSAAEFKERVEAEVRLAGRQAMRTFKKEIEDIIVAEALDKNLRTSMNNLENIEDFVREVIKNWHPEKTESPSLEVLLPEKRREELEKWFKSEIGKGLKKGITINFHKKIKGGFQIESKKGGYRINLTDEDFLEFFKEYLKPRARELLFGERQNG